MNTPDVEIIDIDGEQWNIKDTNVRQYIRAQNKLSDWESIGNHTSEATAYTCPYDGFISWNGFGGVYGFMEVHVNRVVIDGAVGIRARNVETGNPFHCITPVKKGDVVYCFYSSTSVDTTYGAWYKDRDYSDR